MECVAARVGAEQQDPLVSIEIAEQKVPYEMVTKIPVGRTYEVARVLTSGREFPR